MKEFIKFITNPTEIEEVRDNKLIIVSLFGIYLLGAILLAAVASIICKIFSINHTTLIMPLKLVLIGIFLAPIYEEILFRLLLRFSVKNYFIFFNTLFLLTVTSFLYQKYIFFIALLSILILSLIIYFIVKSNNNFFTRIKFKYYFYTTTLLFGLIHLFNFSGNNYAIIIFSIVLVSPQIFLGLILGYIRMKYGILYSIFFHMIVNMSLLFSLLN